MQQLNPFSVHHIYHLLDLRPVINALRNYITEDNYYAKKNISDSHCTIDKDVIADPSADRMDIIPSF